jgi:hypothetical protein
MVFCSSGFSEAWQGVQGARKRPPAGNSHQRPDAPLAHLDLAIPCQVASPQSPTPLHQAKLLYDRRGPWALRNQKDEDFVDERRLHRPFFLGRRGPRGRQASLRFPVDSAADAERIPD